MEQHNRGIVHRFEKAIRWTTPILGKPMEIEARFELLDKDSAQDILTQPLSWQRTCNKAHVNRLAQAMRAGEYIDAVINPIYISDTGKLLDGQHRLTALTQTDLTMPFFVVRGLPEQIFIYLDQNKSRSVLDAVKIGGVRNPGKVAQIATLIYQLMEGRTAKPRNEMLYRMVEDYPDIEEGVAKAGVFHDTVHIPLAVGGTLYFLYSRWWPEECKKFFDLLIYGDQAILSNNQHPITRLKAQLLRFYKNYQGSKVGERYAIQGSHGGWIVYDQRWKAMMFIHQAFKAYRTNKQLRWKEDHNTIDEIAELCRKTITLRNSYTDAPIASVAKPVMNLHEWER